MKKGQIFYVPLLSGIFLLGLILINILPTYTIFGYSVKTIDMFEDVKVKATRFLVYDYSRKLINKNLSNCKPGMVCFEDYSERGGAMSSFYKALTTHKTDKVRIAFFGDSFIEGDVMCGDFRDMLQEEFGGNGVGYVPIHSETGMFRPTIKEVAKGFKVYSSLNIEKNIEYPPFGYVFIPEADNFVEYKATTFSPLTESLPVLRIFYQNASTAKAKVETDTKEQSISFPKGSGMQSLEVNYEPTKKVKIEFTPNQNLRLYGVSFEGKKGVYVDNFSMRGNTGLALLNSTKKMNKALNEAQQYKLIILQYGLNIANDKTSTYSWYIRTMGTVIEDIKKNYPQASILLISVSDRSHKTKNGIFQTMPGIKPLVEAQRELARKHQISFWDLYAAMGGENSMINFVEQKPAKANRDYTHLNFLGGKEVASRLYESIIYGYEEFVEK